MSERRINPLNNEWVAIISKGQERVYRPPLEVCSLCPTNVIVDRFSEIPYDEFEVVVVENRVSALSTDTDNDDRAKNFAAEPSNRGGSELLGTRTQVIRFTSNIRHMMTSADCPTGVVCSKYVQGIQLRLERGNEWASLNHTR
jgi:UDPglucose--hexose-1-phosphate uridylyltransferase